MNYESALEYIHAVQWAGHKPGLTRTRTLLAALGDPHKQLRFIHVAGTNGKGSTAATLCRDNKLPILVFDLADPDNIARAVQGENVGTLVYEG